jgi:hypothetical protein
VKRLKKFQKMKEKSLKSATAAVAIMSLITLSSFVTTTDSEFNSNAPVTVIANAAKPSIPSNSDIVAYDPSGTLWDFGSGSNMSARTSVPTPNAVIPNDFYVTDWDSDGIQDLIVKQTDGQLIFRKGLAFGGFVDTNIGNGWQDYEITIGKWRKTDPNPSIIAKYTPTADLYHYPNSYGTTLDPRISIGTGWSPFSPLNMIDYDLDGNMDIVARKTTTDEMLLYRSNGTGGFINETRMVIGSGWNQYDSIHVLKDRTRPGSVGLLARSAAVGNLAYYETIKYNWLPATHVSNGWLGYKIAGN